MNRRQALAALPGLALAGTSLRLSAAAGGEEVRALAARMAAHSDRYAFVPSEDNPYSRRIAASIAGLTDDEGLGLGLKIYLVQQANAFVLANGSIRIYSGLVDVLDPYELRYVVSHEIGHVAAGHATARLRAALGARAAADVADSELDRLIERVAFSPHTGEDERAADDYALKLMSRREWDPSAAVSALEKFARFSPRREAWHLTHPSPAERAARIRNLIG